MISSILSKWFIVLILSFFTFLCQYYYDIHNDLCPSLQEDKGLQDYLLFHHVMAMYLIMGPQFAPTPDWVYLFCISLTLIHWFRASYCIFTVLYNQSCIHIPSTRLFPDLLYQVGFRSYWTKSSIYAMILIYHTIRSIFRVFSMK